MRGAELKLASIQMVSTAVVRENMDTASRLVAAAAHDGAKLVVLPEYFCLMGLKDGDKVKVREVLGSGPIQEQLASIAKENGIYLVAGSIPLQASDPNKVLNTCLVFNPEGQRVERYDKIHLFGFQTNWQLVHQWLILVNALPSHSLCLRQSIVEKE